MVRSSLLGGRRNIPNARRRCWPLASLLGLADQGRVTARFELLQTKDDRQRPRRAVGLALRVVDDHDATTAAPDCPSRNLDAEPHQRRPRHFAALPKFALARAPLRGYRLYPVPDVRDVGVGQPGLRRPDHPSPDAGGRVGSLPWAGCGNQAGPLPMVPRMFQDCAATGGKKRDQK